MKVFLDANILFSAAKAASRIGRLIEILSLHSTCVTNSYAVEEARKNLKLKRFGSIEVLNQILALITIDNQLYTSVPVPLKTKDVPILGGAIALGCSHLLTGDEKDFGIYFGQIISGVLIISPKQMAEELVRCGYLEG